MSDDKQLLFEEYPVTLDLQESKGDRLVAKGKFGECGKPTANGRIYKRNLIEREIDRLKPKIKNRSLFGETDHPSDGQTKLKRVSHIITDLRVESNGDVVGKLEILEDTHNGEQLAALVENGCQIGVSSRGVGSVKEDDSGNYIVREDFKLYTYDCVADPSVSSALPEFGEEGAYHDQHNTQHLNQSQVYMSDNPVSENNIDTEDIKENHPEIYQNIKEELMSESNEENDKEESNHTDLKSEIRKGLEEIEGKLAESFEKTRQELQENIDDEDSEIVEEQEQLQEYCQTLREAVKQSGIQLALSEHLQNIPEKHHEDFVNLVGEPDEFKSVESYQKRCDAAAKQFYENGKYISAKPENVKNLQSRIEELEIQLETHKDVLGDAREKLKESQSDYKYACRQYKKEEKRNEKLKEKIESYKEKCSDIKDDKRDIKSKAVQLKEKVEELNAKIESKDSIIEQKNEQIETYEEKMELGKKNFREMENKLEDIKEENKKLKEEKENIRDSKEELKEQNESIRNRLEEKDLKLYKHKKVRGAKDPNKAFNMLTEARDKDQVDDILEDYRESEQQTHEAPAGMHSDQSKDQINEEEVYNKIHGNPKSIQENFKEEVEAESPENFDVAGTNAKEEEDLKIVESNSNNNVSLDRDSDVKSNNDAIRGVSPEKAKDLMNKV